MMPSSVAVASTGAAKAARLLRGEHRLALSGTPVQNLLGELWSLFEFLNPGMLGASAIFDARFQPAKPAKPAPAEDAPTVAELPASDLDNENDAAAKGQDAAIDGE